MLKRAEKELEKIAVNSPKADLIIDQLRAVVNGYRSILAAVANLNPDMPSPKDEAPKNTLTKPIKSTVKNKLVTPPEEKPKKHSTANGKWDAEKEKFLLENHETLSPYKIGKRLGVATPTIIYHLKRLGLRDSLANYISRGGGDA